MTRDSKNDPAWMKAKSGKAERAFDDAVAGRISQENSGTLREPHVIPAHAPKNGFRTVVDRDVVEAHRIVWRRNKAKEQLAREHRNKVKYRNINKDIEDERER
tara:strand:- start:528 stop:836 length:309 start_codon:yes stop_codon:yes gene_type:complete